MELHKNMEATMHNKQACAPIFRQHMMQNLGKLCFSLSRAAAMISSVCKKSVRLSVCERAQVCVCVCSIQFFLLRIIVCNSARSDLSLSLSLSAARLGQSAAV